MRVGVRVRSRGLQRLVQTGLNVPHVPGGVLWTEYVKNDAVLLRCRLKSSAKSPAKVAARRTRRAPPTNGPRTRPDRPVERGGRYLGEAAVVW